MNSRSTLSEKLPHYLANLATFITFVVTSATLLLLVLYPQALDFAGHKISVIVIFLPSFFASALLMSILGRATQQQRCLLLAAICGSTFMLMAIPLARSSPYPYLILAGLAFFLGPIIPLQHQIRPKVLDNQTYLYGHTWPWGVAGWSLAVFLLAWLGGRFGLHIVFFSSALLMYVVLLATDRFSRVNS